MAQNSTQNQQSRRDSGPVTERGARRKQELMAAARRVFERRGFNDTRVRDIAAEANVSHGTFYTYFRTKDEAFAAVAHEVVESMLSAMTVPIPTADLSDRVRDSIARFVVAYRPHSAMIGLIEQQSTISPEMRQLRLSTRRAFVERTERGIQRLKDARITDPDLDVAYTAEALGAMLEHTCYIWFALEEGFDEARMTNALAAIWLNALTPNRSRTPALTRSESLTSLLLSER